MEYVTLMVGGDFDAASDAIKAAFENGETAVSFVVGVSNMLVAMNSMLGTVTGRTPQEHWTLFAQSMQAHRPPEWER